MKKASAVLAGILFLFAGTTVALGVAPETQQSRHLELLQKAKAAYDRGDHAQAIAVCDEYIQELGPRFHPQVWFLRGNAYHKTFQTTHKEPDIGRAIESYETGLALYKDVKTFTSLDSVRYQIDGMFNLGLLYEEQYKLLSTSWDAETRKEKEWKILSSISQAMSLAEMYGEWKDPIDDQRERYLDRSLQTFLDMILRSDMPDVYKPLAENVCARGRLSKQKDKYANYARELRFDPSIKACVHWIRGKELAESVQAYDRSINHLRKGLQFAQTDLARATMSRQIADIYLKKDSLQDKNHALQYARRAWALWEENQGSWGGQSEIGETYGASLKAVAVGEAMLQTPDYDKIIQLCHQALRIPSFKDRYYMDYLLSYAAYQKGDEEQFYRHGKAAVNTILGKYRNEFERIQSEEEKEVLLFWVNSLRGTGRILEAMRFQQLGEQLSKNTM